jgi:hypothetical protein
MKTTITINGLSQEVHLAKHASNLRDQGEIGYRQQIENICAISSIDYKAAEIFIANFPERGRYLQKSAGFSSLCAGG